MEAASKISSYEKNKVIAKYKNSNVEKELPMSYSDFKLKHYNMVKTVSNYTKQMKIMELIQGNNYHQINDLFTYLLVSKEEEQLIKSLRKDIESYEKFFDSKRDPRSLSEANDPLRILFKYKKPTDTIESLIAKYIEILPNIKNRLTKLRERKEALHKNINGMIKSEDARFLVNSDIIQNTDPSLLKNFEKLNFDLNNDRAREAMNKLVDEYKKYALCSHLLSSVEESYNLPYTEIMRARKIHESNPDLNYNNILDKVQREHSRWQDQNNFERQEQLQLLIDAGEVAKDNPAFSDDFKQKLDKGQLEDFENIIQRLKNQYQSVLIVKDSTGNEVNKSGLYDDIHQSIEQYYTHTRDQKQGLSKFINHRNGEIIYVDDAKMESDNRYFIKIAAELAKLEMMNYSWQRNQVKEKEQKMLNGIMKSREFRKYYYLMRKYLYKNGKDATSLNVESETRNDNDQNGIDREGQSQFIDFRTQHEDTINAVFNSPQFDISDFKTYYSKDEYEELVKQYIQFTRGNNKEDKEAFLREKLFGEHLKEKAEVTIGTKLKKLYSSLNIEPGKEKSMYDLFKDVLPQELAYESPSVQSERDNRIKYFDDKHREKFNRLWNIYKQDKLNKYKRQSNTQDESTKQNYTNPTFLDLDPDKFDSVGTTLSDVKSLMDVIDTNLATATPSDDHMAFELFDRYLNKDDALYPHIDEKDIYGDDEYEKGYRNHHEMAKKFKDIFEYDNPSIKKSLRIAEEYNLRNVIRDTQDASLSKMSKYGTSKSHKIEFVNIKESSSASDENKEAERVVSDFIKEKDNKTKWGLLRNPNTPLSEYENQMVIMDVNTSGELVNTGKIFEEINDDKLIDIQQDEQKYEDNYDANLKANLAGESRQYTDEYNIKKQAFDNTLHGMMNELKFAVKHRKQYSMKLAMELFNKIQGIEMSHFTDLNSGISEDAQKEIDEYELFRQNEQLPITLKNELTKLKVSLNDQESPSLSLIRKYHKEGVLGLDEDSVQNALSHDLESFNQASDHLENIYDELENKERTMIAMHDAYEQGINHFSNSRSPNVDYIKEKEEKLQNMIEKDIFEAYIEYQRDLLLKNDNSDSRSLKPKMYKTHKVKVIKQIFGVMEGKLLQNFGTDLLIFGIDHDIPDAVRVGENLAALNDEHVPKHVVDALQKYIIDNNSRLKDRINFTGPMKGIIETRKKNILASSDSPYLPQHYDYMMAFDKYNRWRLPSSLTMFNREHGVWEEIYGKEKAERIKHYFPNAI